MISSNDELIRYGKCCHGKTNLFEWKSVNVSRCRNFKFFNVCTINVTLATNGQCDFIGTVDHQVQFVVVALYYQPASHRVVFVALFYGSIHDLWQKRDLLQEVLRFRAHQRKKSREGEIESIRQMSRLGIKISLIFLVRIEGRRTRTFPIIVDRQERRARTTDTNVAGKLNIMLIVAAPCGGSTWSHRSICS